MKDKIETQEKKKCTEINKIKKYNIQIELLNEKIIKKKKFKKEIKLRKYAEIENLNKKNKNIISDIKNNLRKNFFIKILPILDLFDDLKIFLKDCSFCKIFIIEGLELTLNSLEKILKSWKIKKIEDNKIPFNKNLHEKNNILQENKEILLKNNIEISKIIKKGYLFKNKILRKALVETK